MQCFTELFTQLRQRQENMLNWFLLLHVNRTRLMIISRIPATNSRYLQLSGRLRPWVDVYHRLIFIYLSTYNYNLEINITQHSLAWWASIKLIRNSGLIFQFITGMMMLQLHINQRSRMWGDNENKHWDESNRDNSLMHLIGELGNYYSRSLI